VLELLVWLITVIRVIWRAKRILNSTELVPTADITWFGMISLVMDAPSWILAFDTPTNGNEICIFTR